MILDREELVVSPVGLRETLSLCSIPRQSLRHLVCTYQFLSDSGVTFVCCVGSGSGDGNPGPPLESPTLVGLTKSRPVTERRRRPTDNERHSLHLASMKRPLVQSASFEEYDPSQRSSECE